MKARDELTLGKQGRAVIPARLRHALGLVLGDRLVARQEGDRIVLERREAVERRLKARVGKIPKDVSLVDELLADRRADAVKRMKAFMRKHEPVSGVDIKALIGEGRD